MASFGQDFAQGGDDFQPTSFDPIRPGRYLAQIVDSDVQPNKKGTGAYVKLEIDILDGGAEGRKIWEYCNFAHEKESVAVQGQNALKVIQKLCKLSSFDDSTQAHNIPFYVEVKINPAKDGFDASNGIDFRKMQKQLEGDNAQTQSAGPSLFQPAEAPVAGPPSEPSAAPSAPTPGTRGMPWAQ